MGFLWDLMGFSVWFRVLLDFVRSCEESTSLCGMEIVLDSMGFYEVLWGFMRFCGLLLGFLNSGRFYEIVLDCVGLCWILSESLGFHP